MKTVAATIAPITPMPYEIRNVQAAFRDPRPRTGMSVGMPSRASPWNTPLMSTLAFIARVCFSTDRASTTCCEKSTFLDSRSERTPMSTSDRPMATSAPKATLDTKCPVAKALSLTRKAINPMAIAERAWPNPQMAPIFPAASHCLPTHLGRRAGKWSGPETACSPPARHPPTMEERASTAGTIANSSRDIRGPAAAALRAGEERGTAAADFPNWPMRAGEAARVLLARAMGARDMPGAKALHPVPAAITATSSTL
mmetsp:Transcript_16007/g.38947  ORF Transcript_16007/g.38947 Transcript_16007/m.38947 type:complete len:256 (-) Transcript_16007:43-810(-)